jgi:creatinine amidohydrolase
VRGNRADQKWGEIMYFRTFRHAAACTAAAIAMLASGAATMPAAAQTAPEPAAKAPPMRSRLMTSLSGYEVAQYLKRNDVIFVPVGPAEANGGAPIDVEYVIPLAYAMKLAEKGDGLVLPYLSYFYPGGTTTSPATVYVSTSESLPYLKALTRSLIRQGFRRIVFITSHGPSPNTLLPLVRETFDETHVPVTWLSTQQIDSPDRRAAAQDLQAMMAERKLVTYGSFALVGRLDDIPIDVAEPHRDFKSDPSKIYSVVGLNPGLGSTVGNFYADPSEHGGWVEPMTAAERERLGREGSALIDAQVSRFDVAALLAELRKHDEFTKTLEKRYGDLLPPGPGK